MLQSLGLRAKRYGVRGLLAIALTLAVLVAPAVPASATDSRVRYWYMGDAIVELWYSTSGWNWVVVKGVAGWYAEAGIYSANTGWRWTPSYGSAPYQISTGAVYAPGRTCVHVSANLQTSWSVYSRGTLDTWVC